MALPLELTELTIGTPSGPVRGRVGDGATRFLGVPYAEPPVGPRRFAPPVRCAPWADTRSTLDWGAAPPQHASRLEKVMGPMAVDRYAEDCLTVNVWTPAPDPQARLPVVVWIHGGGYLYGSAATPWYDGTALCRNQQIVVVTVDFRVGALGYLYLPGSAGHEPVANLGLQDQRLALEWVQQNIASFGGDPGRVTVAGQSSGAHSVLALAQVAMDSGQPGLVGRTIVQSVGGIPAQDPGHAEEITKLFLARLGVAKPTPDLLSGVPVARILEAQDAITAQTYRWGGITWPFQLVIDGQSLTRDPAPGAGSDAPSPMLVGCTTAEGHAHFAFDTDLWTETSAEVTARIEASRGADIAARLRRHFTEGAPAALGLSEFVGNEYYVEPMLRMVESRARRQLQTFVYRFGWQSRAADGRLGACHASELPFVFGNFEDWAAAPLLRDADLAGARALSRRVQEAWGSFVASGRPTADHTQWPAYRSGSALVHSFLDETAEHGLPPVVGS